MELNLVFLYVVATLNFLIDFRVHYNMISTTRNVANHQNFGPNWGSFLLPKHSIPVQISKPSMGFDIFYPAL